jgi:hypothetical protein
MAMPEATMNQNDSLMLGEHKIRFAGEIGNVESVSKARRVKCRTQKFLRLRVLSTNASHHARASRRVNYISHREPSVCVVIQCL